MRRLSIGFIPLTDAAVLIACAERGFARAEGLEIELHREVSWANIRDKVNVGLLDGAHMLAPLAIASSLGLGHVRVPLVAPFALNLNGNAVTVSNALHEQMEATGEDLASGMGTARALGRVVKARQVAGEEPLVFSSVYAFSTHSFMLRHLFAAGGLDPERDVRLVVVPPPYTAESLRNGLINGFCVGSPWNSVAVEAGVGRIALLGSEIFARAPEKVLGVHARFANAEPEVLHRLVRALDAAARWCETPEALDDLARLLAEPRHLDLPVEMLRRALQGRPVGGSGEAERSDADFLVMHRDGANRPEPAHALWIYAQMVAAGQAEYSREAAQAAMEVYLPGFYDAATGNSGSHLPPGADPVGTRFGEPFTPDDVDGYLARLRGA